MKQIFNQTSLRELITDDIREYFDTERVKTLSQQIEDTIIKYLCKFLFKYKTTAEEIEELTYDVVTEILFRRLSNNFYEIQQDFKIDKHHPIKYEHLTRYTRKLQRTTSVKAIDSILDLIRDEIFAELDFDEDTPINDAYEILSNQRGRTKPSAEFTRVINDINDNPQRYISEDLLYKSRKDISEILSCFSKPTLIKKFLAEIQGIETSET